MLPLVVVPFEPALRENLTTQKKQADKTRRAQALSEAQAILCAVPGRLGRLEGEKGESSTAGTARSEEEGGERARPYISNWPQVTAKLNLSMEDKKLEWLLKCLPPNVLEGYNMFKAGSVISQDMQSALLVSVLWKKCV